jgi:hypothetical protein
MAFSSHVDWSWPFLLQWVHCNWGDEGGDVEGLIEEDFPFWLDLNPRLKLVAQASLHVCPKLQAGYYNFILAEWKVRENRGFLAAGGISATQFPPKKVE